MSKAQRVCWAALGAALSIAGAPGGAWAAAHGDGGPELPFEAYRLPNGLQVILHHDGRLPLVAVDVWYDVGGLHEKEGRSGFAHLFEHMMFQGSMNVPEDRHFFLLQQAGASEVNGSTNFDRTNYYQVVPANQLELALWLESDRMGYLLPRVTGPSLKNQIDVVQNERRQAVDNAPYGRFRELMIQNLFPAGHPYHGNVIGSMEDLTAASLEDVRDFWLTYYTPANATLAVSGAFDPATIKATVEKYFGPLKGRPKALPPKIEVPSLAQEKRFEHTETVATLPMISIAWMAPPAFAPGTAELDLLTHVISGTKSSRLDAKVSYQDPLAQSVTAYLAEQKAGSVFQIDLVLKPGRTAEEALAAIDQVLADLRAKPPTEAELLRAKNSLESRMVFGLESYLARAERLHTYQNFLGDPGKLGWDLARHRAVTTADLSRVLETYLGAKRLIGVARPATAPAPAAAGGAK